MTVATRPWLSTPTQGPIAKVLARRTRWLETLRDGHEEARAVGLEDLADDGHAEDRIRQGYTGRAPVELLQNAHDAMADAGQQGRVQFVVTANALLVANQGKPFDADRIRSLTRFGSSEKAVRRTHRRQIGYKGIGFTSVFEVSDRPEILSHDVGFVFDRAAATQLVKEHLGTGLDGPVPARYFPLPLEPGELGDDEERVEELMARGAVTVVRLPLRRDRPRAEVVAHLRETLVPEVLLFMPAVNELSLAWDDQAVGWTRRAAGRAGIGQIVHLEASDSEQRRSWLLREESLGIDKATVAALNDPLWNEIDSVRAAVAVPWSARGPREILESSRLFSYFPTDDRLGRAVLVHGDFYLDESRRHVALTGAGRLVTDLVFDRAADTLARLAASVAQWGRPLLETCVPIGGADQAGEILGAKIETALRSVAVARPARGKIAVRPTELRRLALRLPVDQTERLVALMESPETVLRPEDDQGEVGELFGRMGTEILGPTDLASRVDCSLGDEPYGSALNLLWNWLNSTGPASYSATRALAGRRIVQDDAGAWSWPSRVERRAADAPNLPLGLRRSELREPTSPSGKALVDQLGITELKPSTALDRLLAAIENGAFGRTDTERSEAIDLSFQVWLADRAAVANRRTRIGALQVQARKPRAKLVHNWRRADQTYFSREWLDAGTLEELFEPLGEAEFLGETPPAALGDRRRRGDFYAALGVANTPRLIPLEGYSSPEFFKWKALPEYRDAYACAQDHPSSGRKHDGWVIDRLDRLLRAVTPTNAAAFARGLLLLAEPYGPEASVQCQNNDHHQKAVKKKLAGYQRWRLERSSWVPVSHDPSGAELQRPGSAWTAIPRTTPWLQVPNARLRVVDSTRLSLTIAEQPRPAAVVAALNALAKTNPDLARAPEDVRASADWLLRRLERVLRQEAKGLVCPPLPTSSADGPRWSTSPVVPNIPGLPSIKGLDLVAAGRWQSIRRAFSLPLATDLVSADIQHGPRRPVPSLLPTTRKAELLAVLQRRGGEDERTAARLAVLREQPVSWLKVSWRFMETVTVAPHAQFVLQAERDALKRLIKGELTWTAGDRPDEMELGRALADYLEVPDDDAEIALYLQNPVRFLAQRELTQVELADAERLLRSRHHFVDVPEQSAAGGRKAGRSSSAHEEALDPKTWSAPPDSTSDGEQEGEAPVREYIDPERTTFGPAVKIEPKPHKKPKESDGTPVPPADAGQATTATGAGDTGDPSPAGSPPQDADKDAGPPEPEPPLPSPAPEPLEATRASGRMTETRAVAIVRRLGLGLPEVASVRDVQSENKGWDLEFNLRSGAVIPVEVKGSSGSGTFVITANEWEAARKDPNYVLYHVVNLTSPTATTIRVFRNLGTTLTPAVADPAGWAVTGWRELAHEEVSVHQNLLAKAGDKRLDRK